VLDLPGIDPQSIDVTQEKNVLTIRAQKTSTELQEGESVTRRERKTGIFQRQFTLPDDADPESIQAQSQHGVLTLTIARIQPVDTVRKIEISQ
jgi:HSP20 family protein